MYFAPFMHKLSFCLFRSNAKKRFRLAEITIFHHIIMSIGATASGRRRQAS